MIVVFVVDTSPSMAEPAAQSTKSGAATGISRLDVAKMAIESLSRSMDKRVADHNRSVLVASAQMAAGKQHHTLGRLEQFDELMLLSTSLQPDVLHTKKEGRKRSSSCDGQHTSIKRTRSSSFDSIEDAAAMHATCGAGGRLLFGCVDSLENNYMPDGQTVGMLPHPPNRADFERELKRLRVATLPQTASDLSLKPSFPEWAGGAAGLNTALSHGLGLLSRYRLTRGRVVEHFGMGRLPWFEHQMAMMPKEKNETNASKNVSPLQPACLVLLTDGECLRLPPEKGGGGLRLQFGSIPLREFYKEPFRWDQRIFILHIASNSAPPLHSSLRALCEVTGGAVIKIQQHASSFHKLLTRLSPPRPKPGSIPDPLRLPSMPESTQKGSDADQSNTTHFINGGPIVGFQAFERDSASNEPSLHRAMLLFAGSCEQTRWILNPTISSENATEIHSFVQSPIWSFPESFYPSKKLDTLPPRHSQPLLHYSRNYQAVGSSFFDPMYVMKALHHLDQLHVSIHDQLIEFGEKPAPIANRMLQRDVFICEFLGGTENAPINRPGVNLSGAPRTTQGKEHLPVGVIGAGRPTIMGEAGENVLNIGILHIPADCGRLKDLESNPQLKNQPTLKIPTLTLLPPDPHILIPLLIKVAEAELRGLNKIKDKGGSKAGAIAKTVHMDESWKSDFRAYIFRLPPYYLPAMRRALRTLLPTAVLQMLHNDGQEPLPLLCMSGVCFNKIKSGEKAAKDGNDWLRGVERSTEQKLPIASAVSNIAGVAPNAQEGACQALLVGYGNYDPRMSISSYKSSLRSMPPPWKSTDTKDDDGTSHQLAFTDILGALPGSCLLPYYESRRRWIFGGTGLTTRGLHVEGTNNDGVNSHYYPASQSTENEPLIALANVGAETINQQSISIMGDFRERLHWSQVPLTGYGGSNKVGSPVTTGPDGSPVTSVEDEVFPLSFFNPKTGEFIDTPQARSRARMFVHFGNPFEEKRGGSIVPEQYESQRPSTPPSSPPHDNAFESVEMEGEGEAAFTGKVSRNPRHSSHSNLLKLSNSSEGNGNEKMKSDSSSLPPPPPPKALDHKPAPPPSSLPNRPKPAPPKRQSSAEIAQPQHIQSTVLDLQNPNQKPQINLPQGWMCVWSKSQKRWYFFDTRTNKSVWEWPPPGGFK